MDCVFRCTHPSARLCFDPDQSPAALSPCRYGYLFTQVLESFNGTLVRNLAHLCSLVDACSGPHFNFGLELGKFVILDACEARKHSPAILATNAIAADRSPDLRRRRDDTSAAAAGNGPAGAVAAAAAAVDGADGQ